MSNSDVRSLGMISPKGTGKTSMIEAILMNAGQIKRMSRVEEGNTVSSYDPEEIERKMTLFPCVCSFKYKGKRIHLVDTAGYPDFFNETKAICQVVDNALMVVSAAEGVKAQSAKFWHHLEERQLPRSVFINEMDKELADFDAAFDGMKKIFEAPFVPITIPMVENKKLIGIIDLVKMKACTYKIDGSGAFTTGDIPEAYADQVAKYNEKLVEAVAEVDDALTEQYLETGELSAEQVAQGLVKGVKSALLVPVYAGTATQNVGVSQFLESFIELSAAPDDRPDTPAKDKDGAAITRKAHLNEPFAAIVFKTLVDQYAGKISVFRVVSGRLTPDTQIMNMTRERKGRITQIFTVQGKKQEPAAELLPGDIGAVVKMEDFSTGDTFCDLANPCVIEPLNFPDSVLALAVKPKERGDEDKLSTGLSRLQEEDPLLKLQRDEQTKELTICGTGQVHLDCVVKRLKNRFAVDVEVSTPKVPYRETVTKPVKYVEYTHKKQTGGAGQYAKVAIDMEPLERGAGYEFVDKIFGGVIDQSFRPSVNKGITARMAEGIIAGYPVTDVRVYLVDGKTHPVDSKDIAFQIAGREVFKKAVESADPALLEPVMNVEIEVPDECMGDIIGDVNSRRGRVSTVDQGTGAKIIKALIPMAEMLRYAPDLDSMTSGRGSYTMELSHYEEVPRRVMQDIVDAYKKRRAAEES